MDFAADAVQDVVAPPARAANARPASARDTSEPSFDDHLEAATADEAPRNERAESADKAKANDDSDATESDVPGIANDTALPEPPAPPHIVQIVAAPAAAPVTDVTAETNTAPIQQTAPIEAAPESQAPPTPAPVAAPVAGSAPINTDDAVDTAPAESKSDAPAKTAATVTAPHDDSAETANAAARATTPTPAPATVVPTTDAPTTDAPPANVASIAAASAPTERSPPAPQRAGKAEPQRNAKAIEAGAEDKVQAPPASPPQAQKNASATTANKDAGASLLALQADAPETPAPTAQQNATPLTQAAMQTQQASAVDHTAVVRATPAAAQVAREIVRRFDGENTRFELRLDPAELGRVDVRLDVSRDHRVTAVIAADNPQALAELSRHARELEQMLNDAGLQLSDSGLSFDLRQGSEDAADANQAGFRGAAAESRDDAQQQQAATAARPLGFERWRGVRVDVMV